MSYREVLDMPITAFWAMNAQISRIAAEFDLRCLTVTNAAQGSEAAIKVRENLIVEMGEPIMLNPLAAERDEKGFSELKAMAHTL
jgi:hypothetical protein